MNKAISVMVLAMVMSFLTFHTATFSSVSDISRVESNATVGAIVLKENGNTNTLIITVNDVSQNFTIDNNSDGVFEIDGYEVYVKTYGNDKISDLFIVKDPYYTDEGISTRISSITNSLTLPSTISKLQTVSFSAKTVVSYSWVPNPYWTHMAISFPYNHFSMPKVNSYNTPDNKYAFSYVSSDPLIGEASWQYKSNSPAIISPQTWYITGTIQASSKASGKAKAACGQLPSIWDSKGSTAYVNITFN